MNFAMLDEWWVRIGIIVILSITVLVTVFK